MHQSGVFTVFYSGAQIVVQGISIEPVATIDPCPPGYFILQDKKMGSFRENLSPFQFDQCPVW